MPRKSKYHYTSRKLKSVLVSIFDKSKHPIKWWLGVKWFTKIWSLLVALILFTVLVMYVVAQWYIFTNRNKPVEFGVTFVPNYSYYFGIDPKETMQALIDELGVKHFRLVSYWDDIERTPGKYDFRELDWQFEKARKGGATVSLAIGLRQPRWPECHIPKWASKLPKKQWSSDLKDYMQVVINRYKGESHLVSYQLENEFFLEVFGICPDFSRDRLIDEYNLVKRLDSTRPTIISRSNNWIGLPLGQPQPDQFGISIYKRVWDKTITRRYIEYPYPAWYYAFYAGAGKILTGKDLMIHELQAEPWTPEGINLRDASTEEQFKSIDAKRLRDRFEFGRATGMKSIDLWGAEWWYWRKVRFNDPSLWNVAKEELSRK